MNSDVREAVAMEYLGHLSILFIALKLTHYIDWSWWWVLGPIWMPTAAGLVLLVCIYIIAAVADYLKGKEEGNGDE